MAGHEAWLLSSVEKAEAGTLENLVFQCMRAKSLQSCLDFFATPLPPLVRGIFQARMGVEWVTISFIGDLLLNQGDQALASLCPAQGQVLNH